MELLVEIVKSVLVIIIIASVLEMLLPDGGVKPFVRFAIGLFIMVAILNPTLNLLFSQKDFQIDFWNYKLDQVQEQKILEQGKGVQSKVLSQNQNLMQEKIEGQIGAMTLLIPEVNSVQVQAEIDEYAQVKKIHLLVGAAPLNSEETEQVDVFLNNSQWEGKQEVVKDKIRSVLGNLYGLHGISIEIEFEGG